MAELKTQPTEASVNEYLANIENDRRREDAKVVLKLMKKVTRKRPQMWGSSIVGFGSYHYVYASGREGDWPVTGFSARKQNLVVYLMDGFASHAQLLSKLGKYKTGKSCLYINKLEDVDLGIFERLVTASVAQMRKKYG